MNTFNETASKGMLSKNGKQFSASMAQRILVVFLLTYAALLLASGSDQILDPFARHDDYPALLRRPDLYYLKTLTEGRWINYLWHLRPFETSSTLNFLIYQAGWATFTACVALQCFRSTSLYYPILLSILISMSPQATLISLWFNTAVPGIWIIAMYALISLYVRPSFGTALLILFVPPSLMVYGTYPFLLLAICLVRNDGSRTLINLVGIVCVFGIAFALGLLSMNALNYFEHGVFDVPVAEWRNPNPARSLPELIVNMSTAAAFIFKVFWFVGFGHNLIGAIYLTVIGLAFIQLARTNRLEFFYILAGLSVCFGLLILHILMEGSEVPFRATLFAWLFFSVTVVRAVYFFREHPPLLASVSRIILLTVVFTVTIMVSKKYNTLTVWQETTRTIAASIPETSSKVIVFGSYLGLRGQAEAQIQSKFAFEFRLMHLTGLDVVMCETSPEPCVKLPVGFDPTPRPGNTEILSLDGITYLRLPATETDPLIQ